MRITTDPDTDSSTLCVNRCKQVYTISHINDLPKGRCTNAYATSHPAFCKSFDCYMSICQPCTPNVANLKDIGTLEANAMSPDSLYPSPQLKFQDTVSNEGVQAPSNSNGADVEDPKSDEKPKSILKPSTYEKVSFEEPKEQSQQTIQCGLTDKEKAQKNLMRCHLQCSHMPFGILMQAAKQGLLPKNIIAKEHPPCPSCLYRRSTRRPWRTKTPHGTIAPLATKPGECVSINQMESSTPGLLAQNR